MKMKKTKEVGSTGKSPPFKDPPKIIYLEITNVCNFKCTFCPYQKMIRPKKFMDIPTFKKIITMLEEDNLFCSHNGVAFHLMGEPLLHPQIYEFISILNERGLSVDLHTNASLISPEVIDNLSKLNLHRLVLSIQTPNEESFNCSKPDSFIPWNEYSNKIVQSVEHYLKKLNENKKNGIKVLQILYMTTFYSPPSKGKMLGSWVEVMKILNSWRDKTAKITGNIEDPRICWASDHTANFPIFTKDEGRLQLSLREMGIWPDVSEKKEPIKEGSCSLPFTNLVVYANGDVGVCCMDYDAKLVVGNIKDNKLKDIWFGPVAQEIRESMENNQLIKPLCQQCGGCTKEAFPLTDKPRSYTFERTPEENMPFQWINKSAEWLIPNSSPKLRFQAYTIIPCSPEKPLKMKLTINQYEHQLVLNESSIWHSFEIKLPEIIEDYLLVKIEADKVERVSKYLDNGDERLISVAIAFEDIEISD